MRWSRPCRASPSQPVSQRQLEDGPHARQWCLGNTMMRRMIGRYKGCRCARMGRTSRVVRGYNARSVMVGIQLARLSLPSRLRHPKSNAALAMIPTNAAIVVIQVLNLTAAVVVFAPVFMPCPRSNQSLEFSICIIPSVEKYAAVAWTGQLARDRE